MKLDDLDYQIIESLFNGGSQLSSDELARQLAVSPRTVRDRITKLRKNGVIEFTIRVNWPQLGFVSIADIFVQAHPARVYEIAEELARAPEVVYAAVTTGGQDVSLQVMTRSTDELQAFIQQKIAPLPGIIRVNTFPIFRVYKTGYASLPVRPRIHLSQQAH